MRALAVLALATPAVASQDIPDHGHPTDMDQARRQTRDDLVLLRARIAEHLDAGGDLSEAYDVYQAPDAHLDTFEELATKNVGRVCERMGRVLRPPIRNARSSGGTRVLKSTFSTALSSQFFPDASPGPKHVPSAAL